MNLNEIVREYYHLVEGNHYPHFLIVNPKWKPVINQHFNDFGPPITDWNAVAILGAKVIVSEGVEDFAWAFGR